MGKELKDPGRLAKKLSSLYPFTREALQQMIDYIIENKYLDAEAEEDVDIIQLCHNACHWAIGVREKEGYKPGLITAAHITLFGASAVQRINPNERIPGAGDLFIGTDSRLRVGDYIRDDNSIAPVEGYLGEQAFNAASDILMRNVDACEMDILNRILTQHLGREPIASDLLLIRKEWIEGVGKKYKLFLSPTPYECNPMNNSRWTFLGIVEIIFPQPHFFFVQTDRTKIFIQYTPPVNSK